MRTFRLAAFAVVGGALLLGAPAHAADLGGYDDRPWRQPTQWSGFYLGGHAGYAWADADWNLAPGIASGTLSDGDWLGGLQAGYNFQFKGIVVGVEGDISWADVEAARGVGAYDIHAGIDYLGTVRGRVGFEAGRFMPYVTGGFAWGNVSGGVDGIVSADDTQTGWTIGGGIEAALNDSWSLKAEYLHIDLGEEDYSATVGNTTYTASSDLTFDAVRLGLNYRFGARDRAPAPLK